MNPAMAASLQRGFCIVVSYFLLAGIGTHLLTALKEGREFARRRSSADVKIAAPANLISPIRRKLDAQTPDERTSALEPPAAGPQGQL